MPGIVWWLVVVGLVLSIVGVVARYALNKPIVREATLEIGMAPQEAVAVAADAVEQLRGGSGVEIDHIKHEVHAKTKMNVLTFGEDVNIACVEAPEGSRLEISSVPRYVFTAIDWGRNARNVDRLVRTLLERGAFRADLP